MDKKIAKDHMVILVQINKEENLFEFVEPCPFCGEKHTHGGLSNNFGYGDGFRSPHCHDIYHKKDYYIKEARNERRKTFEEKLNNIFDKYGIKQKIHSMDDCTDELSDEEIIELSKKHSDSDEEFFDKMIEITEKNDDYISESELFDNYNNYCCMIDKMSKSIKMFIRMLKNHGLIRKKSRYFPEYRYYGIKLKEDE